MESQENSVGAIKYVYSHVASGMHPRQSLVFPAVGQIAGPAAMDASAAIALRKDAIKEGLWKIALGSPALLALLRELDGVLEVSCDPLA